jgi:hypothetical protein
MHDKLMKLMEKKKMKGGKLSDNEKSAKMSVVKDMQDMAKKAMSDSLPGMKKVTVASDSTEGLKEGLEKAEEVMEKMPEEESSEEESSEESAPMEMMAEHMEDMDLDELKKLEEMIEMKKKEKMMSEMKS